MKKRRFARDFLEVVARAPVVKVKKGNAIAWTREQYKEYVETPGDA